MLECWSPQGFFDLAGFVSGVILLKGLSQHSETSLLDGDPQSLCATESHRDALAPKCFTGVSDLAF